MSNNSTPATGITGNTNIPLQQQTAAGSSAATDRIQSFVKHNWVIIVILALVAIYTIISVFVSNDMGLGNLLVTLFLLRYAHKQYEKNSKPTVSSLIGHVIVATIALVIIASPLVQKPLEGFDWATRELGEINVETVFEVTIDPEGTDFTIVKDGNTILNLKDVPEGIMDDLVASTAPRRENGKMFVQSDLYDIEYFREGGVLKARVTPITSNFNEAGVDEIRARAWSRSDSAQPTIFDISLTQ